MLQKDGIESSEKQGKHIYENYDRYRSDARSDLLDVQFVE